MNRRFARIGMILLSACTGPLWALEYPATPPGKATGSVGDQRLVLANRVLRSQWALDTGRIVAVTVTNSHTGQTLRMDTGGMPCIVLDDRGKINLAALTPAKPPHLAKNALVAAARGYDGFLRWAYDSWTADPLHDSRHVHWPAGDCWLVYPGCRSSIRFERLREGIVDSEKIRVLRAVLASRNDPRAAAALKRLDETLGRFTFKRAVSEPAAVSVHAGRTLLTELTRLALPRPPASGASTRK